jgi:long-chain acyl-CoA synthetase
MRRMHIGFLLDIFAQHAAVDALVWRGRTYPYGWLLDRAAHWMAGLPEFGIASGAVVSLEADFSPESIALLLALIERACVAVPLTTSVREKKVEFLEVAEVEHRLLVDGADRVDHLARPTRATNPHYETLRERVNPGLVLFSSGSTGKSKAALHDVTGLLGKFTQHRRSLCAVSFLLYDHIGGFNTLLYSLSNAGCLVTVEDRSPDAVLAAIEEHKAELLPTSPTFINLILLSEAYKRHDLSSLKTVTYGTEPMPPSTLRRFHELFPSITLQQTYGLSELGILRSKSRSSDSLWVRIGGEGFETRIVDGILEIKAASAMLGYLNAPSPFTEDGWFVTGDAVESDGEYLRIHGRKSELIFVGGEKVYPAEIEGVIEELENVSEASVHAEKNPITGQIVCAKISLVAPEDRRAFTARLKKHCLARMQPYKVPVKITLTVGDHHHGARFKKVRRDAG